MRANVSASASKAPSTRSMPPHQAALVPSPLRAGESHMESSYAVRTRFLPVLRDVSTSRPCERRDPYAVSSRFRIGADAFRNKQKPAVMGPCVRRDDPLRACARPRRHQRAAQFKPYAIALPLWRRAREGVTATAVRVATPVSNSPPQGGRGHTVRAAGARIIRATGFGFKFQTARVGGKHSFAISPPVSREFCLEIPALQSEGAGNAGRPMRPQPRVYW